MKTLTSTLALILTISVLTASAYGSRLRVKLFGHRPNVTIVFNGQQYISADNIIRVRGLAPGDYPIKVLRPSHWGSHGVLFKGIIRVPRHSKVVAKISRNGMKVQSEPLAYMHGGGHGQSYWGTNSGYGTVHYNANGNGGFVSMNPYHAPVEPVVCTPAMIGMHPDVFAGALRSIEIATFDSDQIRVAKQIIRRNGASSHQIAEIMRALSHESSRLEIAKFGFQFVGDPQNYHVVNDVFWFSSSIRELDRFINNY
ncbi:MAG: DUF4476 domain-containing protein [Flavobacteriales bacterium]|nr:DUF4476 domain-containing protein [Flavobacteriales bacterium]